MTEIEKTGQNGTTFTKQFIAIAGGSLALVVAMITIHSFLVTPLIIKSVSEEVRNALDRHESGIHPSARNEFVTRNEWALLRDQLSKVATSQELDTIRAQIDTLSSRLNTLNVRWEKLEDRIDGRIPSPPRTQ